MKKILLILSIHLFAQSVYSQILVDSVKNVSLDAEKDYNEGINAFQNKDYSTAIQKFTLAIGLEPNFEKAILNRGQVYLVSEKYNEAIADFEKLTTLSDSASISGFEFLAALYNQKGEREKAIETLGKGISKHSSHAQLYYNRAIFYFQDKKYAEALADLDKANQLKPNDFNILNDRGSTHRMLNNLDKAVIDYKAAILINPNQAFIYNNLGSVLRQKKDFSGAILAYNNAIKNDPKDPVVYNNRGLAYFDDGKLTDALADFNKAIQLNPTYTFAYNNRAAVYLKQKKYEEAVKDCNEAIRLDKDYGEAYLNRGIAKEMLRDEKGACEDWLNASELGLQNGEAYYTSGSCSEILK